ncbi:MAG: zinc ribbon domain-containing protein [Candidatus Brocadiae bacterium]|nr:zinc ribbon domain-containing protein [Candidatus Brocadiia bacterium]
MPIYEYLCNQCEESFETFIRSSNDQKQVACPKCEGKNLTRQFSSFGMKTSGKFTSSQSGSGCSSCSTHSCHSCSCGGH